MLMKALVDEGYAVTAGVLNLLDSDFETSQMLKVPAVTEAPFSPITDKTNNDNWTDKQSPPCGVDVVPFETETCAIWKLTLKQ
jgi:hypothetical protein